MLRFLWIALLCFASSLLGSAVTVLVTAPRDTGPEAHPGYLVAREIVLTDAAGHARVRLQGESYAGAAGGQVVLYDERDVERMKLAMDDSGPVILLQNLALPSPDHKRIRVAVDNGAARIDLGHGEMEEVVLKSGPPTDAPASLVRVNARNGSGAALFTDDFGHATAEVTDLTTATVFRMPPAKPLLP